MQYWVDFRILQSDIVYADRSIQTFFGTKLGIPSQEKVTKSEESENCMKIDRKIRLSKENKIMNC